MSARKERATYIGLETTPGTAVTVDKALRAVTELEIIVDKVAVEEDIDALPDTDTYIGSVMAEGKITVSAANYEEAPYLLSMALGKITASGAGPYTWHFYLPNKVKPTFATYTLEYTDSNGYTLKSADVFAKSLTIEGTHGKALTVEVEITGAESSYPANPSATPAVGSVNRIRMADTALQVNDTWASIGNTTLSGFYDFSFKLSDLQEPILLANSLYPSDRGHAGYTCTLDLTVKAEDPGTRALLRDKLLVNDEMSIRIRASSGTDQFTIDGMYQVVKVPTLDQVEQQNALEIGLRLQRDETGATGEVEVVCDTAAL